jgi:hypothetical protein
VRYGAPTPRIPFFILARHDHRPNIYAHAIRMVCPDVGAIICRGQYVERPRAPFLDAIHTDLCAAGGHVDKLKFATYPLVNPPIPFLGQVIRRYPPLSRETWSLNHCHTMLAPIRDYWTITRIFAGKYGQGFEVTNINYNNYGMGDPRLIDEFQKLVTELQFGSYAFDHLPTHEHDEVLIFEGASRIAVITGDLLLAWVFIESKDSEYMDKISLLLNTALTSR